MPGDAEPLPQMVLTIVSMDGQNAKFRFIEFLEKAAEQAGIKISYEYENRYLVRMPATPDPERDKRMMEAWQNAFDAHK